MAPGAMRFIAVSESWTEQLIVDSVQPLRSSLDVAEHPSASSTRGVRGEDAARDRAPAEPGSNEQDKVLVRLWSKLRLVSGQTLRPDRQQNAAARSASIDADLYLNKSLAQRRSSHLPPDSPTSSHGQHGPQ